MTPNINLFPVAEYWGFYLVFTAFVLGLLLIDLGLFHRQAHAVSYKEATIWCVIWIGLALLFAFFLHEYADYRFLNSPRLQAIPGFDGKAAADQVTLEYLTGFIVEKSLAIDNIFIFVVVFNYFGIPAQYQHRILFFGILGALIFRAIFIAISAVLMQYKAVVYIFGAFLIITGIKLFFAPDKPVDPGKNPLIILMRKWLPITTGIPDQSFFKRLGGKLYATPLFVALVFVEFSDIIFAVDSVPAIFAITREPMIVFTSNVFAILGLRSLYFLVAGMMSRFSLLKYGLGIILAFVGLKMVWLNDLYGGKFPISWSLGFIVTVLVGTMLASAIWNKRNGGAVNAQ